MRDYLRICRRLGYAVVTDVMMVGLTLVDIARGRCKP